MSAIASIDAREILDSKGDLTVEVELKLADGSAGVDSVPSGASVGKAEAITQNTQQAVENVRSEICKNLLGKEFWDKRELDDLLIKLDGTENKSRLGVNAVLPVSMAFARATAVSLKLKLYQYIGKLADISEFKLPRPTVLVMEGGRHGNWATDIQELMVIPVSGGFDSFARELEACLGVFRTLEKILSEKGWSTGVGFEGGYCPAELVSNDEALALVTQAAGNQFVLGIDVAASEFFKSGKYVLKSENNRSLSPAAWADELVKWSQEFPIWSIEDPFDQEEWNSWSDFVKKVGGKQQIVGDDLVVTNVERIKKAVSVSAINAVLIKLNQIGTVTETLEAVKLAHQAEMKTIVSHRAGETNDDFVADFAVGTGSQMCKFGGLDRGERLAKYNRLLGIEGELFG